MQTAREFSRYAARQLDALRLSEAQWRDLEQQPWSRQRLQQRFSQLLQHSPLTDPEQILRQCLRWLRQEVFLSLMQRDLAGVASLQEVLQGMTLLAEFAIHQASRWLYADLVRQHGFPLGETSGLPQVLLVVGMGKLGGAELNVSSDIDLIYLYEEAGHTGPLPTADLLTTLQPALAQHDAEVRIPGLPSLQQLAALTAQPGSGSSLSNHDFFWRMARRLTPLLSEVSAEGWVFRVDLMLRPNGSAGPLAVSLDMLEEYFMVQGRDWERYAWIKGRVVCDARIPAVTRGTQALLQRVTPFVYRRHLDYSALGALRDLHQQIRSAAQQDALRTAHRCGQNIKLGRGGIREIEFVAQVFQLIRGGQDPALRCLSTRQTLEILVQRNLLEPRHGEQLRAQYAYLRQLEHRLQYLEDAQTHCLPLDPQDLERVAQAMGAADVTSFQQDLAARMQQVAEIFDLVFPAPVSPPATSRAQELWQRAREIGQPGPEDHDDARWLQQLCALQRSPSVRAQGAHARAQFDRALVAGLDQLMLRPQEEGDILLPRFLDFMEAISRRTAYLMLLLDYPVVLQRLLPLLAASPWAANYLTQRPHLLDELLTEPDGQRQDFSGYWQRLGLETRERLNALGEDVEARMNLLRRLRHGELFHVLVRDLRGELPVEQVADRLSALADLLMSLVLEQTWKDIPTRHREQPRIAIIAYGKWGSKELGYASDLDLVFITDDTDARAQNNHVQLVRKITQWMSAPTAVGILYELDMQLRPNGNAGLLVTPLEAFRHYQLQERANAAWVWEHQALTRARFCCGDSAIGVEFEALRRTVLQRERSLEDLRAEVVHMRERMHQGHPNPGPLFDVKQDAGGMVDVEFMVQYLVLAHAREHPELLENVGNAALLRLAGGLGLIPVELAQASATSYAALRRLQHRERLRDAPQARIPAEEAQALRQPVRRLWQHLFADQPTNTRAF